MYKRQAQLINALYNIVDRMYIGRMEGVGAAALTGVGVSMPIIMIISAFAALIGMGGAPLTSIRLGAGKREEAESLPVSYTHLDVYKRQPKTRIIWARTS